MASTPTVRSRLVRLLPTLALVAVVVGFGNFVWFLAESTQLGGDALNGYSRDGHYFVSSHGMYTEVGRDAWAWSRAHAISVFVTHPAAILGVAFFVRRGMQGMLAGPDKRPRGPRIPPPDE